jgi:type IV pilus assembly protein PilQ
MPRPPRPFDAAFFSLLLAIGLPATVIMFGAVRSRQLQSTANPRWARFARGAVADAPTPVAKLPLARITGVADHVSDLVPTTTTRGNDPGLFADFTGSITGSRTLDAPFSSKVISQSVSVAKTSTEDQDFEETPPIIFRPVEEDRTESETAALIGRLETQLNEVRQRLDHLAVHQQGQREVERDREQQLLAMLKNLQELSEDVRTGLESHQATTAESPIDPPFEPEPASVATELPSNSNELDIPPSPVIDEPSPSTPSYDGESSGIRIHRSTGGDQPTRYTIEIDDADIRQVFSRLSEAAEISIIPSPEVQGRITLSLHDVRFEAALNAIIRSREYVVERDEGILIVRTAEEAIRKQQQNRQRIAKVYRPNYVSAAERSRLIQPLLSTEGSQSVASEPVGGIMESLTDDAGDRRETIVVQDVPEVLHQIDQILVDLDVPPLQVRIEAKILRVRLSEGLKQGIDLAQLPCQRDSGTSFAEGGLKHASLSCSVPTFVKSIERLADTSVVTSQRLQVLNRHRAEMLIGDRIGYQSKPGGDVQFVESGTRLIMRPSISADGYIRMEIHPEYSSATPTKRNGPPRVNTAELTTQVMIRDGATVAIAGLISEQAIETTKRLPVMSNLPLVGGQFRHRKESLQRTELIVLVTPQLITDGDSEAEGKCLEQATEERAAEFRDGQSHASRHNQARAHFERASCFLQQGNYVKARQQIDASLRLDKSDLQALRLRNEINQCLMTR